MSERTYIAIGCSTAPDYSFLAPLTALMWKEVVGYSPLIFLTRDSGSWSSGAASISWRALAELLIPYHTEGDLSGSGCKIEGYSEGTVAQNIRQHAARCCADDDWIMTADADLWPLQQYFYRQHENSEKRAVAYYSNGDHFQGKKDVLEKFKLAVPFQSIPTCHVVMRAKDWCEVYQIDEGVSVVEATRRTLERMEPWLSRFAPEHQGLARWCCDQWYLTERLCRQEWFPDFDIPKNPPPPQGRVLQSEHVAFVERYGHPPLDRLDRGCPEAWYGKFDSSRYVDAHLHKAPYEEARWQTLLKIVDALIPKYSEWARKYRDEFVGAMR